MKVGVVKETYPGERRVALVPDIIGQLGKRGFEVVVEVGAGLAAGYADAAYVAKGAKMLGSRKEVFDAADIIAQVRSAGANPDGCQADFDLMREGQIIVGAAEPLSRPDLVAKMAEKKVNSFGLELIPRTTRAQAMDILSSMATVSGYRAVLWAADHLPKFFPMFMTAAGTVAPAKVFVMGAGVAGLQAIATAKRLGAIVSAYDIRPAVKEEIMSLGAKFVEMDLESGAGEGGYAKEMDEEFYRKQRELMTTVIADSDVVITTAAVPGRKAPILVTEDMVKGMRPGSVIIDLAAERGGNCELTKAGETIEVHGVTIVGPENVPATLAFHASQMYAKNIQNFLQNMLSKDRERKDEFDLEQEDDILAGTWMTKGGEVVHPVIKEALGTAEGGQA